MSWNKQKHVETLKFEQIPEIEVFYQDKYNEKPGYKYKFWIYESKKTFETMQEAKNEVLITTKEILQEAIRSIEEIEKQS